jgi:hypothetical protein
MIMKKIQIIILLVFSLSSAKGQNLSVPQYKDSLMKMMKILREKQKLSRKLIITCIPSNDKEAFEFFMLDYNKSTSANFWKLFSLIEDKSKEGDLDIFDKYLMMSNYVDGYFAEHYFGTIEDMITVKKKMFCDEVSKISLARVKRLDRYYSNCK